MCVQDRKCQAAECQRMPNFNFPGEKGGVFCSQHKVASLAWLHFVPLRRSRPMLRADVFLFARPCLDCIFLCSRASPDSVSPVNVAFHFVGSVLRVLGVSSKGRVHSPAPGGGHDRHQAQALRVGGLQQAAQLQLHRGDARTLLRAPQTRGHGQR